MGQACFADAARPDQCDEATVGVGKPFGQFVQFVMPSDKDGGRAGQVVAGSLGLEFAGADLFVQGRRLVGRFDGQFAGEHFPAGAVLGHSRAALSVEGQQAHQRAVRFFVPGLQFDLTLGVAAGLGIISASFLMQCQHREGFDRPTTKPLAPEHNPFFVQVAVIYPQVG
jgi:hypothetical protein